MERTGKDMNTSMFLRTKSPNNKQKARTSITGITNQYFRDFLKEFKTSLYLGYKKKQVHNEPNEAYVFLIKHISKQIKVKNQIRLYTRRFKSDIDGKKRVNRKIEHVSEENQSWITLMNGKDLESINVTHMYDIEANKHK